MRSLINSSTCLAGTIAIWAALVTAAGASDSDVIINEIMYNPPGPLDNLQFVELFNRGTTEVDLSNWAFTKGIQYKFPPGTVIGPGGFVTVSGDLAAFAAHYGKQISAVGAFQGRLSHKAERVELSNAQSRVVDTVKYSDRDGWPHGPDGFSSSLERICPTAPSDTPDNWASSPLPARKRASGSPGRPNDSLATNLPPSIGKVEFSPKTPHPQQKVKVRASVADADGLQSVVLLYRIAGTGRESEEQPVPMTRVSGDAKQGVYEAEVAGQAQGQLVRFRVQAIDLVGTERMDPSPSEPRPAYSYFSFTNNSPARIPIAHMVNVGRATRGPGHYERPSARGGVAGAASRGNGAFLYVPPDGGEPETFDFVRIAGRHGGYKVHFVKDRPLKGMTGINLISEGPVRWILAEPLAYSVYRGAGVPAPLTEHVRLYTDNRALGFHLLVEQPNKSFLARNSRDNSGNLYKLLWYGNGVIEQHEKKTNPHTGHKDIVDLIQGLRRKAGADQWAFIQEQFNVDEMINYYAVNMCIQNWDGFFNNYFTYHDTGGTGKWEIYPWDEDKTWGDYDGASSRYDWYEMPLTFGMTGDRSPSDLRSRFGGNGGPFGGVSWWRPPGYFSGPLLANPEFRKRFLARLQVLCATVFTEDSLHPIINAMEQRLEPEVRLRAQATGENPNQAVRQFAATMQSFRAQVENRRKFILSELPKTK